MVSEQMENVGNETDSLKIRLIEPRDDKVATQMIWRNIFYNTAMDIVQDKLTNDRSLQVLSLCLGIGGFLQRYSLFQGLVLFLTLPSSVYLICRYVLLPMEYYGSAGVREGLYKFWSRCELGRRLWVAEVDGAVVGTIGLQQMSSSTAQIHRVSVNRKYRGKGIADRLVETLVRHCTEARCTHIVLMTSYVQVAAQKLYEKKGFKRVNVMKEGLPFFDALKYEVFLYHLSPEGADPGIWARPGAFKML